MLHGGSAGTTQKATAPSKRNMAASRVIAFWALGETWTMWFVWPLGTSATSTTVTSCELHRPRRWGWDSWINRCHRKVIMLSRHFPQKPSLYWRALLTDPWQEMIFEISLQHFVQKSLQVPIICGPKDVKVGPAVCLSSDEEAHQSDQRSSSSEATMWNLRGSCHCEASESGAEGCVQRGRRLGKCP